MVPANRLKNIAFWFLALTLLLLPIGLGGQRLLPFGLAQIGTGLFFLFYAAAQNSVPFAPARLRLAATLLLIVLAWAWLQTTSLPPSSWHHPLWLEAGQVLNKTPSSAISLTPALNMLAIERLATFALMLIGVFAIARDEPSAKRLVTMFWGVGVALCLYGLGLKIAGAEKILWFDKWSYNNDVTGTFVNRNHFADYAGLTFITGIALAWQDLRGKLRAAPRGRYAEIIQAWLLRAGLPFALISCLVLAALLMSHSRAGQLSTAAGLSVFVFTYLIYQRRWTLAIAIPGFFLAIIALAVLTFGSTDNRFDGLFTDASSVGRSKVYEATLDAISANPWFGHGLGSFDATFPLYRSADIKSYFDYAHSDVLESMFDLGIPMAILLFAAIALLVSGCWHGVRTRRQHGIYPALGLGASAVVLLHCTVDFSMQISGVVVSWILLLGVGLGQSWSSRQQ